MVVEEKVTFSPGKASTCTSGPCNGREYIQLLILDILTVTSLLVSGAITTCDSQATLNHCYCEKEKR